MNKKVEKTFVMIKPDGIKKRLVGEVIKRIESRKLKIIDICKIRMSNRQFKNLYSHIYTKYPKIARPLLSFLTKNDVIIMIIEGSNAIQKVQKIRGFSNPAIADDGTIRGDFAKDQNMMELYKKGKITKNIIHSSDNKKQSKFEINLFFNKHRNEK